MTVCAAMTTGSISQPLVVRILTGHVDQLVGGKLNEITIHCAKFIAMYSIQRASCWHQITKIFWCFARRLLSYLAGQER